jgi:hypothetical protein
MGGYPDELQTLTYHIVWISITILWLPAKNTNLTCRDAFHKPAVSLMHFDTQYALVCTPISLQNKSAGMLQGL